MSIEEGPYQPPKAVAVKGKNSWFLAMIFASIATVALGTSAWFLYRPAQSSKTEAVFPMRFPVIESRGYPVTVPDSANRTDSGSHTIAIPTKAPKP